VHIATYTRLEKDIWKDPTVEIKGMFGRAPKGAPARAPCGALPNGARWGSSGHGATGGAANDFHWGGGATKTWLQLAPPPLYSFAPVQGPAGEGQGKQSARRRAGEARGGKAEAPTRRGGAKPLAEAGGGAEQRRGEA
jgi:hypothetical protein